MQSAETEDRWYVNVGGTPKMMNLDEIVEAFEAGTINGKTLVTEVGGSEWRSLKEVADLGDDEEEAQPSVRAPAAASPVVAPPLAAPVQVAKASIPPSIRATQSGWPPVVAASRPPASVAPAGTASASPSIAPSPSGASPSMAPLSTMPMVQDLGLSLDAEFKPRKSKAPIVGAFVVAALIGGVFGISRLTGGGEVARPIPVPAAAPVAMNTATSNTFSTPTPAAAPTPSTTSDTSASAASDKPASDKPAETASSDSRLTDDVKAKLKDSDKSRADKKKAAKTAHAHASSSRSKGSSSSSGVFRAGGNANDPLNSKL